MIIQKYWSPGIARSVQQTMCRHVSQLSIFFDLKQTEAESFMENFERVRNQRRIDFECKYVEFEFDPSQIEPIHTEESDKFEGGDVDWNRRSKRSGGPGFQGGFSKRRETNGYGSRGIWDYNPSKFHGQRESYHRDNHTNSSGFSRPKDFDHRAPNNGYKNSQDYEGSYNHNINVLESSGFRRQNFQGERNQRVWGTDCKE